MGFRDSQLYPPDSDTSVGSSSTQTPSSSTIKKNRGGERPSGSRKKQLGATANFTPYVLLIKPGEDVAAKIMAFYEQKDSPVTILSAGGRVENVTLRHMMGSQCVVTYEGHYELITLSSPFQQPGNNSGRTGMGELCVSLGGLDGRLVGGLVTGKLTAASTVHVFVS